MQPAAKLRYLSSAMTDKGCVRSVNEDAFLNRPDLGLWVVADGMGGHQNGALASKKIVESLNRIDGSGTPRDVLNDVQQRLQDTNTELLSIARSQGADVITASTVVALLVHNNHYVCLWAGDSRAYLLQSRNFTQISRDHSVVQELVDNGHISLEQASKHPEANVVTRAVGAAETLETDMTGSEVTPGDYFLLCSDGLTKVLSDTEIQNIIFRSHSIENATNELMRVALDRGAPDNTTIVIVHAILNEEHIHSEDTQILSNDTTIIVDRFKKTE